MSVDRKVAKKALKKKGFRDEAGAGHDLWWYWRGDPPQKTAIRLAISRGKQYATFGNDLIKYMKSELRLDSLKSTRDFLVCDMSIEEYERHVGPKLEWANIPPPPAEELDEAGE